MAKKAAEPKPPRGTGPFANGAAPLDVEALRMSGLDLIRILGTSVATVNGQYKADVDVIAETVVPFDEVPAWAQSNGKPRRCNACGAQVFRLVQEYPTAHWVCAKCHPATLEDE